MEYTEKDLEKVNEEIQNLNDEIQTLSSKVSKLQELKDKIETAKSEESKKQYEQVFFKKKKNDISKQEFIAKIKGLFYHCLNELNNNSDEAVQSYNKLIILAIECNILDPLEEKIYIEKTDDRNENIIINRMHEICWWRNDLDKARNIPEYMKSRVSNGGYDTYNEILEKLTEAPEDLLGTNIRIKIFPEYTPKYAVEECFDYETSKNLYNELLIPYYKNLFFPTRKGKNNNEEVFCLSISDAWVPNKEKRAKAIEYYSNIGVPLDIINKMMTYTNFDNSFQHERNSISIASQEVELKEKMIQLAMNDNTNNLKGR